MKQKLAFILTAYLFFFTSCKKLIEIDAPTDQLITARVFSNDETAISALTGIYARMNNEGSLPYNITLQTGLYCDELKNYSSSSSPLAYYTNSLNQATTQTPNYWQLMYDLVYQANAVIEGCTQSNTLTTSVKKRLIGEALFIRAFLYIYLSSLYGDVPMLISTDYRINSLATKVPVTNVYEQIISDLKISESSLSQEYVSGNSVTTTSERVRPNAFAAKALLARAYLYAGIYDLAEAKASEVINSAAAYQIESVASTFLKTSKEAIWQIAMPQVVSANTHEGLNFILTARPSSGLTANCTISEQLYNTFENGDKRKTNWIGEFIDKSITPNAKYLYPFKYKVKTSTTTATEYTTPLRLAEQYLIRAEARAQLSNIPKAISDLDTIRKRAGIPLIIDTHPSITKEDLLALILHERQTELFAEWGHRFIDLKRTGSIDQVMATIAETKGGTWALYKKLWPIPIRDIQNNPNLKQNEGYEQ